MLTPDALNFALPTRTTLQTLEARLAVLDHILAQHKPVFATLDPRPYAFGAPLAHALDWHAFGSEIFDTSTVLPNDSRWTNGGVL